MPRYRRPISQKTARRLLAGVERAAARYFAGARGCGDWRNAREDYFAELLLLHGALRYYADPKKVIEQSRERAAERLEDLQIGSPYDAESCLSPGEG